VTGNLPRSGPDAPTPRQGRFSG